MAWRRPCRRWGTHREECVSGCASSGLPGWCTPSGSVCSGRPGAWRLQQAPTAAAERSGRAGGGSTLTDWSSCCCNAYSGRRAG